MAKKSKRKREQDSVTDQEGWISQKTGVWIIAVVSLALVIWTIIQIAPALGLGEAILWGLGFGVALWLVYFGFQRFSRWIRKG